MRKLRLAIALPLLQVGAEGILFLWRQHSEPTIAVYEQIRVTSAAVMSFGLNPLAAILTRFVCQSAQWVSWNLQAGRSLSGGCDFVFFTFVALSWFFIGMWLDRRKSIEPKEKRRATLGNSVLLFLLLVSGVFLLLFSFHLHRSSSAQIIQTALVQTWGVFLIGVPVLAFPQLLSETKAPGNLSLEYTHSRFRSLSNLQWFVVAGAIFAILLALAFLTKK
ncbi:MAG TPA: hypothetical protein VH596_17570 [Terriglobales bacterium]|jgi:hypothetical protein